MAEVTAAAREHIGAHDETLTNQIILRTDGPKVRGDTCDNGVPTEVVREWARVWRRVYGARLGVGNHAVKPRAGKPNCPRSDGRVSYARARAMVYGAAKAAAATCTAPPAKPLQGQLHFLSNGLAPRHAALRQSPHWNAAQEKFLKLTVAKSRLGDAMPTETKRPAGPAPASLDLKAVTTVAFAAAAAGFPQASLPKGVAFATHPHCARDAGLVVVRRLTDLVDPPSVALLVHLAYIVGPRRMPSKQGITGWDVLGVSNKQNFGPRVP